MTDHPDGECARARVRCSGCGLSVPVVTMYGGPMADCRLCCFAWAVHHDPHLCWLRSNHFDADVEEALAARVLDLVPRLIAARIVLGEIADAL
ncbi:hypothetical protein [Streptomyces sp. NPDC059566]|uniref:hypothetical protein n=1 Tax=Streptomyces sp. NPDC059566 TaxID=3346866 RepID=UPI0036A784AD